MAETRSCGPRAREALVRDPHLLGLREEGQDQPRAPHRIDGHGGQDLPGARAGGGRDRDPRRSARDGPEEGLPGLRAGRDDPRSRLVVRRAQHARRDQLRRRRQHSRLAQRAGAARGARGQADPAPDGRRDAQVPRGLPEGPERPRHGRARSPSSSAPSTRSTPSATSSRCWSASSAARRPSSWTSCRSRSSRGTTWQRRFGSS